MWINQSHKFLERVKVLLHLGGITLQNASVQFNVFHRLLHRSFRAGELVVHKELLHLFGALQGGKVFCHQFDESANERAGTVSGNKGGLVLLEELPCSVTTNMVVGYGSNHKYGILRSDFILLYEELTISTHHGSSVAIVNLHLTKSQECAE